METSLFSARSRFDLERCFPVMRALRPHLCLADFFTIYEDAHCHDGYEIVAIEEGKQVVAVMGYRILSDYVRGKHVYVDDLVSIESCRSRGLGAELLRHAEQVARDNGCRTLRLCTGIENERGMKFYERNGWTKRAVAYSKSLT